MAGKGDGDTRSPDYKARRDGYDKIDWGGNACGKTKSIKEIDATLHPLGACGSHCDQCVGGCCGE